ncbi:Glycine receptor subunit alpha-2 [Portunus trituberculatus]|uniref:Glycine receptor subunit alpha-2 n=1 Tax=Portunus trituberculatus TaxID=210409 RepID=A0A5B7CT57_PORTR|nr:Glycine receptor subunit alpha-2 [Portunus trituberculatus]
MCKSVDFTHAIDDKHFFRYNNKPQTAIEKLYIPTVLRRWRHYCHVLSGDVYTVYVDGVPLASAPIEGEDRVLPLNGTFIVGQEQDSLSGRFNRFQIQKGYVTQVNLWSRGLIQAEIAAMANCSVNLMGDVLSTDTDDFELINVDEEVISLKEICLKKEHFNIFPEARTFDESRRMCHLVGSEMYGPMTQKKNLEVNNTLWDEEMCEKELLWIGVTDLQEEGVWRRLRDNKVVTDIFWGPGQPDETRIENCLIMGWTSSWNDYPCKKQVACVVCEEVIDVPLYLRGACRELFTETMFEVLGYFSRKPFFHGFYGYMILKSEEKQWSLIDTVFNITIATLALASDAHYPLGRHFWLLLTPVCDKGKGSKLELSLSTCTSEQYMCNDGQCIDIVDRCDAKDDCKDGTDEDNCSVLQLPHGYRKFKPPKNVDDPNEPLQPFLSFVFLRFLKIEDVQQTITLEFIISLEWIDTRLKFLNLREDMHANKLSGSEVDTIWHPKLEFPNVKDGVIKSIKQNFFVDKKNSSLPKTVYEGAAARVIKQQHYSGSFVCAFDVFYYPFDVQQCSVLVQLSSISKKLVSLTKSRAKTEFNQNSELSTYIISDFFVKEVNTLSRESIVEVGYTLTRHSTLILITIYLPSVLLVAISYSTLYVSVQLLQVRLTVSLTTLLVLYTFFNQASASLPKTAYIKMIDVWFLSCTILLFLVIMIHVSVECLEKESVTSVHPMSKKRQPCITAEGLLRLVRLVVTPIVIVIFGSVYWVIMVA